jgi:hypothetical protein
MSLESEKPFDRAGLILHGLLAFLGEHSALPLDIHWRERKRQFGQLRDVNVLHGTTPTVGEHPILTRGALKQKAEEGSVNRSWMRDQHSH